MGVICYRIVVRGFWLFLSAASSFAKMSHIPLQGASFGASRELQFLHEPSGQTFSFPQNNGDIFAFTSSVNQRFKHGVPKAASSTVRMPGCDISQVGRPMRSLVFHSFDLGVMHANSCCYTRIRDNTPEFIYVLYIVGTFFTHTHLCLYVSTCVYVYSQLGPLGYC